jgi:NadR type nicotinamide-nucleotide adenylyltransferase
MEKRSATVCFLIFMIDKIKRIALIGPESTGKTTLCKELAEHSKTVWVPEYSRGHVAQLHNPYTLNDIEFCAKKQLESEDELLSEATDFIFSDTELIVAKVWCEDVFKICPPWIEEEILKRKYDLYLLTYPDLPFIEDPVRENPFRREYFYSLYKTELEKRNFNFVIVTGTGSNRFKNARKAIAGRFSISDY